MTPLQYLTRLRIQAKELLQYLDQIGTVAELVGYSDPYISAESSKAAPGFTHGVPKADCRKMSPLVLKKVVADAA